MQVILLMEVILPVIHCVLKSTKNSSLKIKQKDMRTFHVQLQFKQSVKVFQIVALQTTYTILASLN